LAGERGFCHPTLRKHKPRIMPPAGFAAKVVGVIDSVSTGSGSDRIRARPQKENEVFVIKETSGSRRYRSGY